jgi:hypothetical protein
VPPALNALTVATFAMLLIWVPQPAMALARMDTTRIRITSASPAVLLPTLPPAPSLLRTLLALTSLAAPPKLRLALLVLMPLMFAPPPFLDARPSSHQTSARNALMVTTSTIMSALHAPHLALSAPSLAPAL